MPPPMRAADSGRPAKRSADMYGCGQSLLIWRIKRSTKQSPFSKPDTDHGMTSPAGSSCVTEMVDNIGNPMQYDSEQTSYYSYPNGQVEDANADATQ